MQKRDAALSRWGLTARKIDTARSAPSSNIPEPSLQTYLKKTNNADLYLKLVLGRHVWILTERSYFENSPLGAFIIPYHSRSFQPLQAAIPT